MPAKIAIITYSTYGHIDRLADEVEKGVKAAGAHVTRYQLPETLPQEVLAKLHAPPKPKHIQVLQNPDDLKQYDGFLFGFPTRYGARPSQVAAFFDKTGGLWMTGGLVGKFAGIFTSTASQHGGQETTALTTIPFFAHHGIIYVPIGYANSQLTDNSEVLGGSPYGASTIANGDGSRQPVAKELEVALDQGKRFGNILNTYIAGSQKLSSSAGGGYTAARSQPAPSASANVATASGAGGEKAGYKTDDRAVPNTSTATTATATADKSAAGGSGKKGGLLSKLTMSCGGKQGNYES